MVWLLLNYVLLGWLTYYFLYDLIFNRKKELGLYFIDYYKITPSGLDFRIFIVSIVWPILIIYCIKNLL